MKRRNFLKYTGAGVVVPSLAGGIGAKAFGLSPFASALASEPENDKVLVLVYLNGGNDGLNTVIPLDQLSSLNAVRPHVMLPESSLLPLEGTNVALHPSMQGFKELYDEDRLQIIQGVGYPNPNFSHFRSTDIWMSGSDSDEIINNGLPGRYLSYEYPNYPVEYPNPEMPDPLAIEIGWNSSLLFQGTASSMGMVISDPEYFYGLVGGEVAPAPDTNAGEKIEYIRLIAQQSQVYGEVVRQAAEKVPNQGAYPETDLANQLKIVARLIAGGLKTKLYLVQIGGFDTHDSQVEVGDTTQGEHAELLKELSDGVNAFMKDCDGLGISDKVMGMTFSEFGRRIISNASNGTDHGSAAPQFLFGNHVNSTVLGSNPIIPPGAMYEDNLDMQYDFRSLYASVFEQWFCIDNANTNNILLNSFETLPVTSSNVCSPTSTHDLNQIAGKSYIHITPNPVGSFANIKFQSIGRPVKISIYDTAGRMIDTMLQGTYPRGSHSFDYNASRLPAGSYYVHINMSGVHQSKMMVKI